VRGQRHDTYDAVYDERAGGFHGCARPDMMWRMDELSRLTQARSLLLLLLATCKQTQLALDAVANVLDTQLSGDLGAMIERSEVELGELTAKIEALSAK
jgi:hypothetical protein